MCLIHASDTFANNCVDDDDVIHSGNHDNHNHPKAAGAPAVVYVFHK